MDKEIILFPGMCPIHNKISVKDLLDIKKEHPKSEILVHPECNPEVVDIADHVFSTNGMVNHVKASGTLELWAQTSVTSIASDPVRLQRDGLTLFPVDFIMMKSFMP